MSEYPDGYNWIFFALVLATFAYIWAYNERQDK